MDMNGKKSYANHDFMPSDLGLITRMYLSRKPIPCGGKSSQLVLEKTLDKSMTLNTCSIIISV